LKQHTAFSEILVRRKIPVFLIKKIKLIRIIQKIKYRYQF
jgi:hypothetical protein